MAWKVYDSLGVAEAEHYHLALQVAELDTAFGEHDRQMKMNRLDYMVWVGQREI